MNEFYVRNVVEAALLAAGKPLLLAELGQLFDESVRPKVEDLQAALEALTAEYTNRGLEVKETAAGFRIQVRKEFGSEISRLWPERPAKYSRALLETLALIAYRQPITRAEIEAVRGVAVNPNIVKTVIERNWVRVVGHRDVPGRPELLGTTREFLDYFGLRSLDELPPLADVKTLGDYNLQLELPNAGAIGLDSTSEGGEGAAVAGLLTNEAGGEAAASGAEAGVEGTAPASEGAAAEVASGEAVATEGAEVVAQVETVEVESVMAEGGDAEAVVAEGIPAAEVVAGEAVAAEGTAVEAIAGETAVAEGTEGEAVAVEAVASASAAVEAVATDDTDVTHAAVDAEDAASDATAESDVAHEAHAIGEHADHEAHAADEHAAHDAVATSDVEGDAEAERTLSDVHALHHTAESDESESSESNASSESLDSLDDASDDDADEDELSADGHGSRELVASPRDDNE